MNIQQKASDTITVFKFLFYFLLFCSFDALAGDGVRGGGDTVTCSPSKKNTFVGVYPLGYLQMQMTKNPEHPKLLKRARSCHKVLKSLKAKLKKETPVLGAGFENYIESFFSRNEKALKKTNENVQRKWTSCESQTCLNDYKDEGHFGHLGLKLPSNCKKTAQFALRTEKKQNGISYINYYLNESILKKMTGPMCAFNLVHEWLRDFLNDSGELYPASLAIFSDHLRKKINAKQGLYEYLPASSLIKTRPSKPLKVYFQSRSRKARICSGKKGRIVCNFSYVQIGSSFGIVSRRKKNNWTVVIPRRHGPYEKIKNKKSNLKKIDLNKVPSGFLEYLLTLPIEKLMEIKSGT